MDIWCFQLNIDNLKVLLRTRVSVLWMALLQEPYTRHSKLIGLGDIGSTIMCGQALRASVLTDRDLEVWPLINKSAGDVSAVPIEFHGRKIVIASV